MLDPQAARDAVREIIPTIAAQTDRPSGTLSPTKDVRKVLDTAVKGVHHLFVSRGTLQECSVLQSIIDTLEDASTPGAGKIQPAFVALGRQLALPLAFGAAGNVDDLAYRAGLVEDLRDKFETSMKGKRVWDPKNPRLGVTDALGAMLIELAPTQQREFNEAVFLSIKILQQHDSGLTPAAFEVIQFRTQDPVLQSYLHSDLGVRKAAAAYLKRTLSPKQPVAIGSALRMIEFLGLPHELSSVDLTRSAHTQISRALSSDQSKKRSPGSSSALDCCAEIGETLPFLKRSRRECIALSVPNKDAIVRAFQAGLTDVITRGASDEKVQRYVAALVGVSDDSLDVFTLTDAFRPAEMKLLVSVAAGACKESEMSARLLLQLARRFAKPAVKESCVQALLQNVQDGLVAAFREREESFSAATTVERLRGALAAYLDGTEIAADDALAVLNPLRSLVSSRTHSVAFERLEYTCLKAAALRESVKRSQALLEAFFEPRPEGFSASELLRPADSPLADLKTVLRRVAQELASVKGASPFIDQLAADVKEAASAEPSPTNLVRLIGCLRSSAFGVVFPGVETYTRFATADAIASVAHFAPSEPVFDEDTFRYALCYDRVTLHLQYGANRSAQNLIEDQLEAFDPRRSRKEDAEKICLSLISKLTKLDGVKTAAFARKVVEFLDKFDDRGSTIPSMNSLQGRMIVREAIDRTRAALPHDEVHDQLIFDVSILCNLSRELESRVATRNNDGRFTALVHVFEASVVQLWFVLRGKEPKKASEPIKFIENCCYNLREAIEKADQPGSTQSLWYIVSAVDGLIVALNSIDELSRVDSQRRYAEVLRKSLRTLLRELEAQVNHLYVESPLTEAVNRCWEKLHHE